MRNKGWQRAKSLGSLFFLEEVDYGLIDGLFFLVANEFLELLAFFEEQKGGDFLETVLVAEVSVALFIDVDFDYGPGSFAFLLLFVKDGCHLFARIAPSRAELDYVMVLALYGLFELLQVFDLCVESSEQVKASEIHEKDYNP